ncbi:MAG: YihA family ribosome biogenesis GTP-binding protein [Bernardetiaceae bacterium]|nr:YihA family ribosome biogenesis GTP-binding protein [Bernardetiaceae bacterium]
MLVRKAEFIKSSKSHAECPPPKKPEYAFIGRSNVGKSSLINTLTNKKSLAKTSARPGKTQLINHFVIDDNWYLTDLPGYGWARVSRDKRMSFMDMIKTYLETRPNLVITFVLIDVRHNAQSNDLEFMQWLGFKQIPFAIIFTKADKLSPTQLEANIATYEAKLLEDWAELPPTFVSSAHNRMGIDSILHYIHNLNQSVKD